MKKTFTTLILLAGMFMLSTAVVAQQYDVPATYATVAAAFEKINADIAGDPSITQVTINIAEGTVIEEGASRGVEHTGIKVTIQGAGADKTFLESFRGARIIPGEPDSLSTRWIELTAVVESCEYTIKDLTVRYFGRGDNDNGGVFSTSTSKGFYHKMTIQNVVFDRCGAKQGAIWHGANGTHEFVMDNCLIIDCVTYGGSAFAGPIAVDNGGMITISNCTFMSNVRNPWDHRSDPANPIDKGAGRGGVIKVKDGTIRNVPEPYPYSPLIFTLENCAFVNNLVYNEATKDFPAVTDSVHPAIEIAIVDTTLCEVTLVDNILIENRRDGYETTDVDFMIPETWDNVLLTEIDNVMNSAVLRGDYQDAILDGSVVNRSLTYVQENLKFTMDGDLPALIPDAFGIGHVEYEVTGDISGVESYLSTGLKVYPNPSSGQFNILLPEDMYNCSYEVFNITGSLMKSGLINSSRSIIDLSREEKGIYLLRIINNSESNTMRLVVK